VLKNAFEQLIPNHVLSSALRRSFDLMVLPTPFSGELVLTPFSVGPD
jgi:hypothetical protein